MQKETGGAADYLAARDKRLGAVIRRVGPCPLTPRRRAPFEALVRSVVYQQLNGTAAATILGRVLKLYPDRRFPAPADLLATSDEQFRAAGLSGAKMRAIRDIAEKTISGVVPTTRLIRRMSDKEIVERLTEVRGVGPWTVEMLLIFTLGRPDVLPATDYGVRQGFAKVYGLPELPQPKELLAFGECWRPHRSAAAWYLWRALEVNFNDGTTGI
jgi:DNA-3-methyladenine glycosylase II